ncbi:MAG: DUF3244 domain-containing protein [Bacteroidales bacterium]|nr:DUF3244 domain-containing protein [Bacteroidales bacterium]
MKRIISSFILIIGLSIYALLHAQQSNDVPVLEGYEKIVLQGRLETGTGPNDIGASVDDDTVYIGFGHSFGNVSITLCDGLGYLVYNSTINTSVQDLVSIPFSGSTSGTYRLALSNSFGVVEGSFYR